MSRLIDADAAIDVIRSYMLYDDNPTRYGQGYEDALDFSCAVLDQFPTAKPETIRCLNCKYYQKGEQNETD